MGGWVDGIVLLWLERYDKGTTGREECPGYSCVVSALVERGN